MHPVSLRYLILLIHLLIQTGAGYAQICQPDVFSITYNGNAAFAAHQTIRTSRQEIVSVGDVLQVDGTGFSFDAWAYKLSARGTVLWAKRYMPAGYNSGYFNAVAALPDGSYLVAGRFSYQIRQFPTNQIETLYSMTVLANLDPFGNLNWMKTFRLYQTANSYIENLSLTRDGDVVGSVTVSGINLNRRFIFRMDTRANVKWSTLVDSDSTKMGSLTFQHQSNGQLLFAGWAYNPAPDRPLINREGYYLLALDPDNGRTNWSRGYFFSNTPRSPLLSASPVPRITETRDGRLFLFSSLSDSGRLTLYPFTAKALMLITSSVGTLQKAVGFDNGEPGCGLMDAEKTADDGHLLFMNDAQQPLLAKVNKEAELIWHKGYGRINGNLTASSVFAGAEHLQLYFKSKFQVSMSTLMQVETNGALACMETASQIRRRDLTQVFSSAYVGIKTEVADKDLFETNAIGLNRKPYTLATDVSCVVSCCTNIGSDTVMVTLCNQPFYRLPDGTTINESGTYYQQLKTRNGCDSTAFIAVALQQSPVISLGEDRCLEGNDSVILKATGGYEVYNWMNSFRKDSIYAVKAPGTYWVSVSNNCGYKTDSVVVYQGCDFDDYMPDAFTPNNDGKNDVFRYPAQSRNRFVRLSVFNRWGQKVFETRNRATGWSGNVSGVLQETGTYVYILETRTPNGKTRHQKGTVTLIR